MQVFTVLLSAKGVQITETVAFKFGSDDICKKLSRQQSPRNSPQLAQLFKHRRNYKQQTSS